MLLQEVSTKKNLSPLLALLTALVPYDCLTEITGKLRLLDWETAEEKLGPYGAKAKKVIAAAALHNTNLDLYL